MKICWLSDHKMIFVNTAINKLLLVFLLPMHVTSNQCSKGSGSHHGFMLKGHVFQSFTTDRLAFCYSACNTNLACQSLNFNLVNKTCELNSELNRSRPENFTKREIHVYAENPDRGKQYEMAISKLN